MHTTSFQPSGPSSGHAPAYWRRQAGLLAILALACAPLGGCAALYTAITASELEFSTRMSDSIFLDPVASDKRTIFIGIQNTTGKKGLDLKSLMAGKLAAKGYMIVNDPKAATFVLQTNTLYVGEANPTAAEAVFEQGAGAPFATGALAAGVGLVGGLKNEEATAVGVVAGAVSALADWMVRDVTFTIITDIRITERTENSFSVREEQNVRQGASGKSRARSTRKSNQRVYEARVLSTARQVNLELEEALPGLKEDLAESIAGIF